MGLHRLLVLAHQDSLLDQLLRVHEQQHCTGVPLAAEVLRQSQTVIDFIGEIINRVFVAIVEVLQFGGSQLVLMAVCRLLLEASGGTSTCELDLQIGLLAVSVQLAVVSCALEQFFAVGTA